MVGISSALVWAIVLNLCTSKANPQKIQKTFTLEELVPLQADFAPERVTVQFISDSEYIIADPRAIHKINAKTDIATQLLDEADMAKLAKYGVSSFSNDQKYVLLVTERKKVYRYSVLSKYSVYNLESKSIGKIGEGLLQVVMWDNGHSIAYVQNNNVFYVPNANDTDVVIPLTTDGIPGKVYYGVADWIYEEEIFNAAEAMWFSKNGSYLAVASFNDTLVESAVFPYYGDPNDFDNQYPEMITFKYPKVGEIPT
ncbi:venom dipeptidyl peptidase 4-like isoform X3 [Leptidea sinapis]|uniref:venom dipeptidyl peptidase 4-like isoform X3 n=1 Tax=Leptidea sinapis TaxID=189913 RepID=UPI0021C4630B|nr:venom dipeptidyl peptidase 4-like isoform X3 [Leptidea sinapis]